MRPRFFVRAGVIATTLLGVGWGALWAAERAAPAQRITVETSAPRQLILRREDFRPTLKNPSGRTSLVGLSVLNYNPHNGQFTWPSGTMPGEYKQATAITIVGHDKALSKVVGEDVTPERFDMMIDEAEGDNLMAKLSTVAEGEDMMTVNSVLVDPYTAQLALQVYEGLKTENQERMEAMTVYEVIATHETRPYC